MHLRNTYFLNASQTRIFWKVRALLSKLGFLSHRRFFGIRGRVRENQIQTRTLLALVRLTIRQVLLAIVCAIAMQKFDPYFDSAYGPRFWQEGLARGNTRLNFDFQKYRREVEVFEARITNKWGWNRRDFSNRNWTEFAQFYRTVTFRWAQAVLREHIISELNSLLARLGIYATISISGLPSPQEILTLRKEMAIGNIPYVKVYELTSI